MCSLKVDTTIWSFFLGCQTTLKLTVSSLLLSCDFSSTVVCSFQPDAGRVCITSRVVTTLVLLKLGTNKWNQRWIKHEAHGCSPLTGCHPAAAGANFLGATVGEGAALPRSDGWASSPRGLLFLLFMAAGGQRRRGTLAGRRACNSHHDQRVHEQRLRLSHRRTSQTGAHSGNGTFVGCFLPFPVSLHLLSLSASTSSCCTDPCRDSLSLSPQLSFIVLFPSSPPPPSRMLPPWEFGSAPGFFLFKAVLAAPADLEVQF